MGELYSPCCPGSRRLTGAPAGQRQRPAPSLRPRNRPVPCPGQSGGVGSAAWASGERLGRRGSRGGEKPGLGVGLQPCFAEGWLRGAGAEPCRPWCCPPRCGWQCVLGGGEHHLPPVPGSKGAPQKVVRAGSWKSRRRHPAASSATGPITAPSFGDVCKQNKEDERLMHGSPDSRELGCDTSPPLGYVADIIHRSRLTCHRSAREQSGLGRSGSSQLPAAARLRICQLTKDPNYTHLGSPIHC